MVIVKILRAKAKRCRNRGCNSIDLRTRTLLLGKFLEEDKDLEGDLDNLKVLMERALERAQGFRIRSEYVNV
jgi:hypothetical protein